MPRLKLPPQPAAILQPVSDRRPPRPDETENPAAAPVFNDAESPLAWLRSRKDKAGNVNRQ